jgi:hypothetical protein
MNKQKDFDIIMTVILSCIIIVLITMSSDAKQGAKEGISLCENIIIPSLLPILILTNAIVKSRASNIFENIFGGLFKHIFKLPAASASAIIFGLISGFPAGAVLTSNLYNNNLINQKTAQRIMMFNFSGGIAFTITAVGTIYYKSTKIGIIIYIINIISNLLICIGSAILSKRVNYQQQKSPLRLGFSDALVEATNTTVKSIAVMCAYIILFSSSPIFEITNGIFSNESIISLPLCAAFLSFGGFCIHFQLMGLLKEMNVNYLIFLIGRIISAMLSFVLAKLYLYFYPETANVFSNISSNTSTALSQVNTGLSIIMVIGCAVVIFDIEGKKLKLH